MNRLIKASLILSAAVLFSMSAAATPKDGPVILLIQAKGNVLFSADGKIWKNIRRNKFLYEGWHVRTGHDGTCKLIDQHTGMIQPVDNNIELVIRAGKIKAVKGVIDDPERAGTITGFLKRKFAKMQKYTVIKRHSAVKEQTKLKTAKNIRLSKDYPDLVWENIGPEYSYQLIAGEKVFDVPSAKGDMIRFRLPRMKPGQFDYCVQVLYKGEILYSPEKKNRLTWLSDAEMKSFQDEKQDIQQVDSDNGFLLGNFMDEKGLKVAAMDQYRKFLSENPGANETRLFLIKIYNDLKLKKMKQTEIAVYQSQTELRTK